MKLQEIYKQCTAEGCAKDLSVIDNIDDNITIGEMRAYLTKRKTEATKQFKAEAEKLITDVKGKVFRIKFAPDHLVILYVKDITIINAYGDVDGIITGECIVDYKGQVRLDKLVDTSDRKWSNYFPNQSTGEIGIEKFKQLKRNLKAIKL